MLIKIGEKLLNLALIAYCEPLADGSLAPDVMIYYSGQERPMRLSDAEYKALNSALTTMAFTGQGQKVPQLKQ